MITTNEEVSHNKGNIFLILLTKVKTTKKMIVIFNNCKVATKVANQLHYRKNPRKPTHTYCFQRTPFLNQSVSELRSANVIDKIIILTNDPITF